MANSAGTNNIGDTSSLAGEVNRVVALNILCSIALVFINNRIYTEFGLPNITLTCLNFVVMYIGLEICHRRNMFQLKRLPVLQMLPLALTFCGCVVFTKLSLETNTVGTHQLIKTMTTPCIMFIQTYYYAKSFSTKIQLTMIPIAVGGFLNSFYYYDVEFNFTGMVFATIGVFVTSVYQIRVGETQAELQVNAMQLLFNQAPLTALLLMIVIPFAEPLGLLSDIVESLPINAYIYIIGSGIMALMVNLSVYWLIRNTSPVTYSMVGQLKFCLTILDLYYMWIPYSKYSGYIVFRESPPVLHVMCMLTTLSGVILYTLFKIQENKKAEQFLVTTKI